jgi:predicted unusual protein kinase regulating ubiquinone biosynthesis (AarF/ABC1/UbiB family)
MQSRTSFGELFVELGQLAVNYQFTCPAYYVLVMRSFVTLEGVAARADSSFNIYTAAVPYAVRR